MNYLLSSRLRTKEVQRGQKSIFRIRPRAPCGCILLFSAIGHDGKSPKARIDLWKGGYQMVGTKYSQVLG